MDTHELAWAAGYFDGEGSVQIGHRRAKPKHYALRVTMASTSNEMIVWFQRQWGGSVYLKRTPPGRRYKPAWYWQLGPKDSVGFLQDVLPYLKNKRTHAELGIAFQATSRRWGGGHKVGHAGKPEEALQEQREIFEKLKALNFRGLAMPNPVPPMLKVPPSGP